MSRGLLPSGEEVVWSQGSSLYVQQQPINVPVSPVINQINSKSSALSLCLRNEGKRKMSVLKYSINVE
jgi:hypothetical protein